MRAKNEGRERSKGRSQRQCTDGELSVAGCAFVCVCVCVCSAHTLHICGCYMNSECMSALAFLCAPMRVCVSVPSVLRRGTVCAQSCSTQMALANRHCKAGSVGTAMRCTVGTSSHHAFPYVLRESTCCHPPEHRLTV